MSEYRILPPVIKRSGLIHKLIERKGMIAIYKSFRPCSPDKLYGYVVAKITREKEARFKNGNTIPARERFPSPSRIGRGGGDFYLPTSTKIAFDHYHKWVRKFSTPYPPENPSPPSGNTITPFEDENREIGGGGVVA